MAQLLGAESRPTAVVAFADILAIGAIRAVRDVGLRVPEDVSVVGFDDIPPSAFLHPSLTTVVMPKWEMGKRATDVLMTRIQEGAVGQSAHRVILPTTLIVRESTGPSAPEERSGVR
jgi:DNA-binding LacI/PurR family transcriptional regulator